MLSIEIPGRGRLEIKNVVLDVNGTIAVDGNIPEEIKSKLSKLQGKFHVYLLTADTYGMIKTAISDPGIEIKKITPLDECNQKADFIRKIGSKNTIAIGNGANDVLMLKQAAIGIAVIGKEGACSEAILNADLVVSDISNALDILLNPMRLIATLRR